MSDLIHHRVHPIRSDTTCGAAVDPLVPETMRNPKFRAKYYPGGETDEAHCTQDVERVTCPTCLALLAEQTAENLRTQGRSWHRYIRLLGETEEAYLDRIHNLP